MADLLRPRDRILFQGDSITDADRQGGSAPLGAGYVAMVAGMLRARRPDLGLEILNRGISGDRTAELLARWRVDCLDLKPQVLSIKIGVNDLWRKLAEWNGQKHIALPEYRANLEQLCDQALRAGVRLLVLVSPTTIAQDNADPINQQLGEYAEACRAIAASRGGIYVDARGPLLSARAAVPGIPWTPDGCHPSTAGHALIASAWCQALAG
jgi:lysophospholipase L1-like esterase